MAAPFATVGQVYRGESVKIRSIAATAAIAGILALTGCSSATPHTGTVTGVAQQGTTTSYSVEVRDSAGFLRLYACDSYRELACALLEEGDEITFSTFNGPNMYDIGRKAAAANA